jgi:hypothetical protein
MWLPQTLVDSEDPRSRPSLVPDSFEIIVVSK